MQLKKKLAISETGFIFDPTSGDSYSLNEVGNEIINKMKEGKTDEEIKQAFLDEYEIDPPTFERTFYDFIAMLRLYNLIEEDAKA